MRPEDKRKDTLPSYLHVLVAAVDTRTKRIMLASPLHQHPMEVVAFVGPPRELATAVLSAPFHSDAELLYQVGWGCAWANQPAACERLTIICSRLARPINLTITLLGMLWSVLKGWVPRKGEGVPPALTRSELDNLWTDRR